MTNDEIIEMANKAYAIDDGKPFHPSALFHLVIFAKLVAAKEREACALICDKEVEEWKYDADVVDVAIAIRARGEA